MRTTTITKSAFFHASRETVWEFLTNKDKLGEWYYPAEADFVEGEDYCLYRVDDTGAKVPQITGRVIELKAPVKLVTTFVIGPFNGAETTITWTLEEAADGTRLLLTHEGIAEAAGAAAMHLLMALDDGWDKHLADLRGAVAK
ncbi:MAG: SRPBCC domain-containing protein [Alphaproteobacteria bacterium]|nr:SRPBCC domain-containing protein [Alphaproteobacteria bacterium]